MESSSRARAFAVDIDGTLLTTRHEISPAAKEAIATLRAAGVLVVLSTARYPGAVHAIVADLDLWGEPIVASQGALLGTWLESGSPFVADHSVRIPLATAHDVSARAAARGVEAHWYYEDSWLAEHGNSMVEQEVQITGISPRLVASLRDVSDEPMKLSLVAPPEHHHEVEPLLAEMPTTIQAAVSRPDYIEVVPNGTSKWAALEALFARLGIPPEQVAAIGDGHNDLEMISGAGLSFAMGGAPEVLKNHADHVVPGNDDDGLAVAVRHLLGHDGAASPSLKSI